MDKTPLLVTGAPAEPSLSPPLPPCPAPVDQDAKNAQEAGGSGLSLDSDSKKGADATGKTAEVSYAGKKEEGMAGFRRWVFSSLVGGRGGTGAGAGDGSSSRRKGAAGAADASSSGGKGAAGAGDASTSGGIVARKQEHVVHIDGAPPSSTSPALKAPGWVGVESADARTDDRLKKLIDRADASAGYWSAHSVLADPAADMAAALRNFAAAQNAATADALGEVAAALAKIVASTKLEKEPAEVAKALASEAAALAGGGWGADPPKDLAASSTSSTSTTSSSSRSPEVLFYIAIPGSIGLLPYLNSVIPGQLQAVVAVLFGTVFSAATMGAVLIARARDKTDIELATMVGAVSFTAFSLLVILFVSFTLVGGNLVLIGVLAALVFAVQIYAWVRK